MKKLIIPILLLCFFIIPKNTFALEFTDCKGLEHSVDSNESMVDYFYFNKDSSVTDFTLAKYHSTNNNNDQYEFYSVVCSSPIAYQYSTSNIRFKSGSDYCSKYQYYSIYCDTDTFTCNSTHIDKPTNNYVLTSGRIFLYNPIVYTTSGSNVFINASSYNEESILTKYNCNGSEPEPEPSEEVNMFDVVETFLVQFVNILPFIIPFILIMNLICRMLFNERS